MNGENATPGVAVPVQAPQGYPFPRDQEGLLDWSHADQRLSTAQSYWIATSRPDGRPHVTPVWGVWLGGYLYMDGHPHSRWARNLAANGAASIHLESGSDVVILEGVVDDITTDVETAQRIVDAWNAKYGRLSPDPAGSGLFRFTPRTARAWSEQSLGDGTRWVF